MKQGSRLQEADPGAPGLPARSKRSRRARGFQRDRRLQGVKRTLIVKDQAHGILHFCRKLPKIAKKKPIVFRIGGGRRRVLRGN
jgi:hypothetical protein